MAIDVKADRLQKGAYEALERGVDNVFFVRARADQINELCTDGSASVIWLTFCDPFPRQRSAGRRMTHPTFLAKYRQALAANGHLYLKHDNPDFFCWSLEQLVATGWQIDTLTFDLYETDLPDDYKIITTYEERWQKEGRLTQLVRANVSSAKKRK